MFTSTTASQPSRAAPRLVRCALRQFKLPTPARFVFEALLVAGLFLASVWMSGEVAVSSSLGAMGVSTAVMMLAMIGSGVYRRDIWHSVSNIYLHSAYGFAIGASATLVMLARYSPELLSGHFAFLFFLLTFFGLNTFRPLLSGSELTNGVGRRAR